MYFAASSAPLGTSFVVWKYIFQKYRPFGPFIAISAHNLQFGLSLLLIIMTAPDHRKSGTITALCGMLCSLGVIGGSSTKECSSAHMMFLSSLYFCLKYATSFWVYSNPYIAPGNHVPFGRKPCNPVLFFTCKPLLIDLEGKPRVDGLLPMMWTPSKTSFSPTFFLHNTSCRFSLLRD